MIKTRLFSCIMAVSLIVTLFGGVACGKDNETTTQSQSTTSVLSTQTTSSSSSVTTSPATTKLAGTSVTISDTAKEYNAGIDGKVNVVIPANTLAAGTKLEINELAERIPLDFGGFVPLNMFQISASQTTAFGGEITIEFSYDKDALDDTLDHSSQIAVAYYNEDYNAWQEVDVEIDKIKATAIVKTNHLSLWSLFVKDEKYVTLTGPRFTIYFNEDIDAPRMDSMEPGDPIYQYAAIARTGMYDAIQAYEETLGLKIPEHTKVYIDAFDKFEEREAEWGWFSKNIEIPTSYYLEKELKMAVAHEMFHAVQNEYVTFAKMDQDRWFMEATADYAAAYVATAYGLSDKLPYSYLNTGISHRNTEHMYQTAHFIKYLVDCGYDFKEMFEYVISGGSIAENNLNAYLNTKGTSLIQVYKDFVWTVIFDNNSWVEPLKTNITGDIAKYKLELDLDKKPGLVQTVEVGSYYAAALMAVKITSSEDLIIPITVKATDATVYSLDVQYALFDDDSRSGYLEKANIDSEPTSVSVFDGQYLYFLVINDAQNASVIIEIGEAEEEKKPEPYSKSVVAYVYNKNFMVDVDFYLQASAPFVIEQETEHPTDGSIILDIIFDKSDKDISIDMEAIVTNARFSTPDDWAPYLELKITDMYWETNSGEVRDSRNRELILADSDDSISAYFIVILGVYDTQEGRFLNTQPSGIVISVSAGCVG